MLWEKSAIVYLTRSLALVYDPLFPSVAGKTVTWDGKDATPIMQLVRTNLKATQVKLILGNDISYVVCLSFPTNRLTRDIVLREAASVIPEEVTPESFDWKRCKLKGPGGSILVQAVASSLDILHALSDACRKSEITVSSIDAIGTLLGEQTASYSFPHITLWTGNEQLAVASSYDTVFQCAQRPLENLPAAIERISSFILQTYQVQMKHLILDGSDATFEHLSWPGIYTLQKHTFLSVPLLVLKKPEKGDDKDILALRLPGFHAPRTAPHSTPSANEQPANIKKENKNIRLVVLLMLLFLLLILTVWVVATQYTQ